jgi:PAP2 superfamily
MSDLATIDTSGAPRRSFVAWLRRLDWKRVEARYDRPSESAGAARVRKALALLFFAFAAAMTYTSATHGDLNAGPFVILLGATALFAGRGGRFVYYFVPVFLGLLGYSLAGGVARELKLGVHYLPQLRAEEWLTPGPIPTVWLQEHLYHGSTGPLEVFSVAMYVSHFWVPLALGFGLAMAHRSKAFLSLMFGLLAVAVLGEITFVLAPTAPPWLAAQHGLLPDVHHVLKQSLYDLHLGRLADLAGDPTKYDVTAAVPSLHVAFPVICVLTCLRYRLPRWVMLALVLNTLGVVFAIVYTGEHYLFDALVGAAYAGVAWWLVHALLGREWGRGDVEVPAAAPAPAAR